MALCLTAQRCKRKDFRKPPLSRKKSAAEGRRTRQRKPEYYHAYQRRYYHAHKKELRAYQNEYRRINKQRINAMCRKRRNKRNKQFVATRDKYIARNLKKIRAEQKQYRDINRVRLNIAVRKCYARTKTKPRKRFVLARITSRRRGYAFLLSLRQYTKLIEQPCYYCGTSMANSMGTGLDRLDNRYGYSKKNVVTCCGICNRTRGIYYTPEETKVESVQEETQPEVVAS